MIRGIFIVIVGLLITFSLLLGFFDITGKIVSDTEEWKEIKLGDCVQLGRWELENSDFKFTECPEGMIMKGAGINVAGDNLAGGISYCCNSDVILEDCREEGYWEHHSQDYKITICPRERPIMAKIGVEVDNNNQAGGKAYCCKGKNVELYSCAYSSYWIDKNKDYELTVCPEDKQILSGVGFNVVKDNQAGGKAYCCKGKMKVTEEKEIGVVEEEKANEGILTSPEVESMEKILTEQEKAGLKSSLVKIFCKIFNLKNQEGYDNCISESN